MCDMGAMQVADGRFYEKGKLGESAGGSAGERLEGQGKLRGGAEMRRAGDTEAQQMRRVWQVLQVWQMRQTEESTRRKTR